jgi:hypothetical protein
LVCPNYLPILTKLSKQRRVKRKRDLRLSRNEKTCVSEGRNHGNNPKRPCRTQHWRSRQTSLAVEPRAPPFNELRSISLNVTIHDISFVRPIELAEHSGAIRSPEKRGGAQPGSAAQVKCYDAVLRGGAGTARGEKPQSREPSWT